MSADDRTTALCGDCEEGVVYVCPRGHGLCDCTEVRRECEACGGTGEIEVEEDACES